MKRFSHASTRTSVGRAVAFATIGALSLCAAAPQSARAGLFSVSPKQEKSLGDDAAKQIEAGARLSRGPVEEWVNRVGARLAAVSNPEWKYTFRVIDSPEINAFALPGGHVYVYTGLRKVVKTDDELAAVLAHEITHAENHHYAKQYGSASKRGAILGIASILFGAPPLVNQAVGLADTAITQKYSRSDEYEADRLGMERMTRAGFDPRGMVALLQNMKTIETGKTGPGWLSDHPDAPNRVTAANREYSLIQSLQKSGSPLVKPRFSPWTSPEIAAPVATADAASPEADAAKDAEE